ncbi:MAG: substrate-binding domain-containing protein [Cellvibrionaceae bacterium]|nr:substrate-binding domain-containing protein [Cellvibrionaceae bacterium]
MKKILLALACATSAFAAGSAVANSRDHIMIVGSSTVFPFSKVVAERFSLKTGMKAPKVEPTGTGGGFKEFCKGVGVGTPDIANASRRIKDSEFKSCQENGVKDIVEVFIGYDGIVIANSKKSEAMNLTRRDLFLALAKVVPDPKGGENLVPNPYKTWKDVNPALPAKPISVMGPPPTSGTRDAFVELGMEGGCKSFPWIAALDKSDNARYKAICHGVREDGAFIEAGENDNLIVRKLSENANLLGIFGFSFLDQNADVVNAARVDGQEPTFESISDGSYPVSRPLYFYVKKAHVGVIPGIEPFLEEFTSERAWGDEGYLAEKGMIPMSSERRKDVAGSVKKLESMSM